MKKRHLFSYTILLFLFFQNPIFGQLKHLKDVKNMSNHPRILLLKDEEKNIQKSIEGDKNWAKIHQAVIAESDKIIPLPTLERIQIGRRLLDKSRECLPHHNPEKTEILSAHIRQRWHKAEAAGRPMAAEVDEGR